MRAVMLSDAHAAGPLDDSQRSLVQWLEQLDADHLFLLGDVFHHWWGFPGVVMAPYADLVAALANVWRRGIAITLVPGNHDFAVGTYLRDEVGIEVCGAHTRVLDGVRFHLAHGDEADRSLHYTATRRLLRGTAFAAWMRAMGPERAYRQLAGLAGSSRAHGGDPTPLVEAQQRWARERLEEGVDVVVMGHIHVPLVKDEPAGRIVHLGDWVDHRTWLVVEDGKLELVCGMEGRPWRS